MLLTPIPVRLLRTWKLETIEWLCRKSIAMCLIETTGRDERSMKGMSKMKEVSTITITLFFNPLTEVVLQCLACNLQTLPWSCSGGVLVMFTGSLGHVGGVSVMFRRCLPDVREARVAPVTTSFLLLVVRHLFLIASCYYK